MFVSSLKHNRGESCLKEGRNWVNVIVEAFEWVEVLVLTYRARNFHCLDKCIGELNWNRAIGEIVVTFDLRMAPMPHFVIKKPNRQLSIRKRYVENYFLSSNDQVFLRGARIIAVRLALMLKFDASLDITARRS